MQPAAPQPVLALSQTPSARNRRIVWIAVLAVVVVVAVAVGAFLVLRPSYPGPASVDALKALLVDVPGKTTTIQTDNADSGKTLTAGSPGLRWSATRLWHDDATPGSVVLTQFDTAEHASAVVASLRDGLAGAALHPTAANVPGVPGGFTMVNPTSQSLPGSRPVQPIIAGAAKGPIVVTIFTSVDSVDWVRALLAKQVNALRS